MTMPAFQLIMQKGPTPGHVYDLTELEIRIGREATSEIAINDAEVSRRHAILRLEAGNYIIEDCNSTNGTWINGQRLMGPHSLISGELIKLGENVEFIFRAVGPDMSATALSPVIEKAQPQSATIAQAPQPGVRPTLEAVNPPLPVSAAEQDIDIIDEAMTEEESGPSNRELWLMAGFGCLVLLAVACAAMVLAIEYFNLWCTLFGTLIPGC